MLLLSQQHIRYRLVSQQHYMVQAAIIAKHIQYSLLSQICTIQMCYHFCHNNTCTVQGCYHYCHHNRYVEYSCVIITIATSMFCIDVLSLLLWQQVCRVQMCYNYCHNKYVLFRCVIIMIHLSTTDMFRMDLLSLLSQQIVQYRCVIITVTTSVHSIDVLLLLSKQCTCSEDVL